MVWIQSLDFLLKIALLLFLGLIPFCVISIIQKINMTPQYEDKESEVSCIRLDHPRNVPETTNIGLLKMPIFLKHILNRSILPDSNQKEQSDQFQDNVGFINELYQIIEKHQTSSPNEEELNKATCQYIHQVCMSHREASKFNVYSDYEPSKVPKEAKCKCGCGKAQGEPLSLCTEELKHYFFGPAILVFFFLRKIIILIILIALVYGLYGVITNSLWGTINNNFCDKPGMLFFLCPLKMQVSTLNKLENEDLIQIQLWIGLGLCIVWVFGTKIIRSKGRVLNKKIDDLLDSSSDYVIQISNLPASNFTQKQIINYIGLVWKRMKGQGQKPPAIKSVQIVYKMDQTRTMIKKIIQNALKLSIMLQKQQTKNETKYKIIKQKIQYEKTKTQLVQSMLKIQQYRQKFINNDQFRKLLTNDVAYVQFVNQDDKLYLLSQIKQYRITLLGVLKQYVVSKFFTKDQNRYAFKGNDVRITRAPQPSDINWSNCQKKNSYKRVLLVWLIALAMVLISFGIQLLIRFMRSQFLVLQSLSILVSMTTQVFNRIIWNTLVSAISLQQNNTKTQNIISTMSKGAFAQAINVLVLPLIFNYVMKNNIYGPEGIIGSTFDYHFTFLIMQTFFNLLNVPYQWGRFITSIPFLRNWLIRRSSNVVGVVDTAEEIKDVLTYYETPSFNLASTYTSTNTIIFHTIFYIHVQPFLIFTLIFNLCYVYFMHKYLLLRRYKIPEMVDFIIFENCLSYLQHVPLIYSIGSLTFMSITQTSFSFISLRGLPISICMIVWFVCVLNPFSIMNKITKKLMNIFGSQQVQLLKDPEELNDKIKEDIDNDDDQKMFQRKESYHSGCGTNDLLEYEAKLTEVKKDEDYVNLMKLFCQRFSLKPTDHLRKLTWFSVNNKQNQDNQPHKNQKKKNSMKMLSKIKQSFVIVKQRRQSIFNQIKGIGIGIGIGIGDNKIVPLNQSKVKGRRSDQKQNGEKLKMKNNEKYDMIGLKDRGETDSNFRLNNMAIVQQYQ